MTDFEPPFEPIAVDFADKDPVFQQQVHRFHRLTVYSRWVVVGLLWLIIAPICLWSLRSELDLWHDYFTWTAVRYTILYNRLPILGLSVCLGSTLAVLIWQSRNILFGFSEEHLQYLEHQVLKIRRQGKSHPLWQWVCEPSVRR